MIIHVVEPDVGHGHARGDGYAERSCRAMRVEVVKRVFIVPGPVTVVGRPVPEEEPPGAIVIDDLDDDCRIIVLPGIDRRKLAGGGSDKADVPTTGAEEPHVGTAIGGVVVMVACGGVVGRDIVPFAVVQRAGVERRIQVVVVNLQPLINEVARQAGVAIGKQK